MKLTWGKSKQLVFKDELEYYKALGILCNSKLVRIYLEYNKKTGSYSDAYRIMVYKDARSLDLTPALKKAMKDGGRINCNEYVKNIIDNHNFVLSGNTVIANLENVIKSIPNENHLYLVSFMSGYSLITSKNNMVMYTTDSIDVSNAVLNKKEIPVNKKSGNGKNKNKKRTGKRDYIKNAISNFEIGEAGEKIVYEHEKKKLIHAISEGKLDNLENKLDWVSRYDDSAGYDIKSYDVELKKEMLIEVKTTTGKALTPFFISNIELITSHDNPENYYIYRLYDLDKSDAKNVNYYILEGDLMQNLEIEINTIGNEIKIKRKK